MFKVVTSSSLMFLVLIVFNILVGGYCADYTIYTIFGKHIAVLACLALGFFLGEFIVPAAIICWILTLCGIATPWIK